MEEKSIVEEIKRAEEEAEKIIKEAEREAEQIISRAEKRAEEAKKLVVMLLENSMFAD